MNVRIAYCKTCRYEGRAYALAEELRAHFGAEVEVVEGKFGQFDVWVDGALVATRGESFLARMLPRDAPGSRAIREAIERHVAPQDGEFCAVPDRSTSH